MDEKISLEEFLREMMLILDKRLKSIESEIGVLKTTIDEIRKLNGQVKERQTMPAAKAEYTKHSEELMTFDKSLLNTLEGM